MLLVKLYPELSNLTRDKPPIASFIIRVLSSVGDRKVLIHPGRRLCLCSLLRHHLVLLQSLISHIGLS